MSGPIKLPGITVRASPGSWSGNRIRLPGITVIGNLPKIPHRPPPPPPYVPKFPPKNHFPDTQRRQQEEARKRQQEEARRRQEEEARRRQQEETRRRQQEEARRRQQEEARRRQQEEARRRQQEEARRQQEETRRRQQEEARRRQQEDARRRQQEDARRRQQEDARRRQQEDTRKRQEEEARKRMDDRMKKLKIGAIKKSPKLEKIVQPKIVIQIGNTCWAAALDSWLASVDDPQRQRTMAQLLKDFPNVDLGFDVEPFRQFVTGFGMDTNMAKVEDFSPDNIKYLLTNHSVVFVSFRAQQHPPWWHDVVIYDVKVDALNQASYSVMNPSGKWINNGQRVWVGAGYQQWEKKDFFPVTEEILIGYKVRGRPGKAR